MTSTTDLNEYASLSAKVAALTDEDDLIITPADFPNELADHTPFDGLVIDTSFLRCVGWAGEGDVPFEIIDQNFGFEGFAEPDGFRRFGLWLLHFLFSGKEWAGLTLTRQQSRAQSLYVRIVRPVERVYGLKTDGPQRYSAYEYSPQEVWRHPFADAGMAPIHRVDEVDRPFFAFGWSRDAIREQYDIDQADQIIFEATPDGIAAMACVMMDMAHPTLGREEVDMEPPVIGFAATQHRSIEARFWLPNSIAFYCDTLDQLVLPPTQSERLKMYQANSDKII